MDARVFEKWKPLGKGFTDFLKTTVYLDVSRKTPRLINFSISQFIHQEKTKTIIRFDCSHGYLNVHRYYRNPNDRTDYPEQKPSAELYEKCKKDILQNWKKYKEYYSETQRKYYI